MSTRVSIIIPTLNAERYLPNLINSLKNQTIKDSEIIVIDSTSGDKTVELSKAMGVKTLVIPREQFNHGGTRNLGAKMASGDILVFMTQDALPEDNDFIENLVKPLEDDKIKYVYGRQVPYEYTNEIEKFSINFNYGSTPIIKDESKINELGVKTFFCSNVASAIRKDYFLKNGGFPEDIILGEDFYFASKVISDGYTLYYQPLARVRHSHNYTLLQIFKRYFDTGVAWSENNVIKERSIKADGEGAKLVKAQLKYFIRKQKVHTLTRLIFETGTKLVAYKLGYNHRLLNKWLKIKLSMHKNYWK